jgi:hypothetical protein
MQKHMSARQNQPNTNFFRKAAPVVATAAFLTFFNAKPAPGVLIDSGGGIIWERPAAARVESAPVAKPPVAERVGTITTTNVPMERKVSEREKMWQELDPRKMALGWRIGLGAAVAFLATIIAQNSIKERKWKKMTPEQRETEEKRLAAKGAAELDKKWARFKRWHPKEARLIENQEVVCTVGNAHINVPRTQAKQE